MTRMWIKSLALLFAWVVICRGSALGQARPAATASAPASRDSTSFRVMTFNIRYGTAPDGENSWRHRRPLVADLIRRLNSEIVGLQEALRFQLDDLHADLPGLAEFGVGRDDGRAAGEYAAILYDARRFVPDPDDRGTFCRR